MTADGYALGSLCVFDTRPGGLDPAQAAALEGLGRVVVALFERRRETRVAELMAIELERRGELSAAVLSSAEAGIVVTDPAGRLTSCNDTARAWHGLDADTSLDQLAGSHDLYAADGTTP